jgi:large subunit ribosomal protein L3
MAIGLVGRKSGMTRVFTEDGASIPVTVVEVSPNRVTQIKELETDGYRAIQVTAGNRKASKVSKSEAGHFAKAGVEAGSSLLEFRLEEADEAPAVGSELTVERFEAGQVVDVTGKSKGKGFQGGVKRWNFSMQDATHGNSISHRAPGSIGQCQTPGRVFKGKKMAGHMGAARVTTQNLEVVKTDADRGLVFIKGAVPGSKGGWVTVKDAVKKKAPEGLPFPAGLKAAATEAPAEEAPAEGGEA